MRPKMRFVLCVLLILLAYAATGCAGNRITHFTEADEFLRAGKTVKAKQAVDSAIKASPDKYKAVLLAAGLYMIYNKDAEAEQLLVRMLDDNKKLLGRKLNKYEQTVVLLEISNLRYEQGRILEAAEPVEQAIKLIPDHHELQNSLAYFYAEADTDLEKALDLAVKAHSTAPNKGHITDTLGWVHCKMGNFKQAKHFLQLAVKQSPESAEQRYHLGVVYLKLGEKSRAWIELRKALAADPKMTKARNVLRILTTPT